MGDSWANREWFTASGNGHTKLIRWVTHGLAVGGGATIVLLRGALVAP